MTLPNDFDFPFTGLNNINASGANWDVTIDDNLQLLRDMGLAGESIIAFRRDQDLDGANHSLFVVPTGWYYVPTKVLLINTASTVSGANLSFGTNASTYDNWISATGSFSCTVDKVKVLLPDDTDDLSIMVPTTDFRAKESAGTWPGSGLHVAVLGFAFPDDGSI